MSNKTSKNLLIDEKVINFAKIYSSLIKDDFQRKRAYASLTALYGLVGLVETTGYNIQKAMTIFRNPELNEKFEISDFYVNNWHIDVRVVTEGDAFLVPKIHFDYSIVPDFYAVVRIDKELKTAELIGMADAKVMKKDVLDYHYYSVDNSELMEYEDFVDIVREEKNINFPEKEHEAFRESYLGLIDKEIDTDTQVRILKHLFECPECRTEFCCFTGFEMVNCHLGDYPDILDDKTLNVIGAQDADSPKYEGKEETIYIGDDEEEFEKYPEDDEQTPQDNETVSDILDELFNVEEETANIPDNETSVAGDELMPENLEFIDDNITGIVPDGSFQIIDDNNFPNSAADDIQEIESIEAEPNEDMMLIDNGEEENLLEEPEDFPELTKQEDINKVIVDYDATGEPVYSYITNVNPDDFADNTLEPIEDVEINEEFPTEPLEEAVENPVENIDESPLEKAEEDVPQEVKNDISDDDILDYPPEEKSIIDDDNPSEEEYSEIQNIDDGENEESAEEDYAADNEGETEDSVAEEETEDSEAAEEYEEDDSLEPGVNAKKSSKTGLLIALALVVLAVPAAILGTKYIKSATADKQVNVQVPDTNTTNDMFEQPDSQPSGGDLIPAENANPEEQGNEPLVIGETQGTGNEVAPPEQTDVPSLTEKDLINKKPTNDVNKVMADAFSQSANHVSVTGVNWMCAPALFTDKTFKNYLQDIDKVLKLNLNKNILDATQSPVNNAVAVKFAIDNNGNLLKTQIASSSGSDEIDNIVLQSIKETLETQKTTILTDSDQKADKYLLKVVIKL